MNVVRDFTDDEVVSIDVVLCDASSIFDIGVDIALNDSFVKLVTWCDNGWGLEPSGELGHLQSIDG